jgi:DNA-binding NarL/FixJ family response regulator
MDTELPREDGVTTTQRLKMEMPAVTVVMLRVHDDSQTLFEAIKVGAQGYLVKNVRSRELLERLRGLARGEIAERPVVSEHTVKNHMKNILTKLRLRNQHQAVVYGVARSRMPGPGRRG